MTETHLIFKILKIIIKIMKIDTFSKSFKLKLKILLHNNLPSVASIIHKISNVIEAYENPFKKVKYTILMTQYLIIYTVDLFPNFFLDKENKNTMYFFMSLFNGVNISIDNDFPFTNCLENIFKSEIYLSILIELEKASKNPITRDAILSFKYNILIKVK